MSEALYAVAKKPRIMCCIQDSEDVAHVLRAKDLQSGCLTAWCRLVRVVARPGSSMPS